MALKRDIEARRTFPEGAYDKIPKSVLALVAWHLADAISSDCDHGPAQLILEEWETLVANGFDMPKPSSAIRRLLNGDTR